MFFTQPRVSFGGVLVLVVFSMGVAWCAATWGINKQSSNLSVVHRVGEVVQTKQIALSVESVRRDEVGAGPLTPREGYEFVVPTITLKNISDAPFDFIPLLYFYVEDNEGNVYSVVAVPSEKNQISGPVLPSDIVREEVGFEVKKGAQGLTLHFTPGTLNQQAVVVGLEHDSLWKSFVKKIAL